MATLVSDPVRWVADQWEDHCGYSSAVLSGIVPDKRHLDNGGFHCSVQDLRRYGNQNDYSNTRPDDRDFNVLYGAAIDVSMSPADMKRCHARVHRVWADTSDPRRKYINAINTWDGSGDAVRLDFYAGTGKYATPDHKWHNHGEIRRRYLLDWTAAKAIVSVLKGESKTAWLASQQPAAPQPQPVQEAPQMELTDKIRRDTGNRNRTVDDVLADLSNLRNFLVTPPGGAGLVSTPQPGSPAQMLASMVQAFPALVAQVAELSGRDFTDEPAIVRGVLAGLTPEAIAAAIPPTVARQVADELVARLAA